MRTRVVFLGLFAACAAPPLRDALPLDPLDKTLVIAVESGLDTRFIVRDVTDLEPLPSFVASTDEPLRLTVLGYDLTVNQLGFAPVEGELSLSTDPRRSRLLAPWARARTRTVSLDEDSGWSAADAQVEMELGDVRVAAAPPCRAYARLEYTLTSTAEFVVAYAHGPDHAIARQGDRYVRFDRDGARETSEPLPGLQLQAATNAPDGAVFLAGEREGRREVWLRRPGATTFESLPVAPQSMTGMPIRWMSARSATALWTMTEEGRISSFDGAWTDHGVAPGFSGSALQGGLAAISRDAVDVLHPFAFTTDPTSLRFVTELRPDRAPRTYSIRPMVDGLFLRLPFALSRDANNTETLYGSSNGGLDHLRDGAMVPVDVGLGTVAQILRMIPIRSGIWSGVAAAGLNGVSFEYYETGDTCRTSQLNANLTMLVPIGDDLLQLGQGHAVGEQTTSGARTPKAVLVIRGPAG